MNINLNQPISWDQFKAFGTLVKSSRSIVISIVSACVALFSLLNCYDIYANYEIYEQKNTDFLDLNNQIRQSERKLSKLINTESQYFYQLTSAPSNKSILIDALSNLASKNNLIVKKLLANEGVQSREKDGLIEVEIDGKYQSIVNFLTKVRPIMSASDIKSIKLEKKKENQYVHLSMAIKFSEPPQLKKLKPSLAFMLNRQDYYFDTFADWRFTNAGFVQIPETKKTNQESDDQSKNSAVNQLVDPPKLEARPDPFLPSPKNSQQDNSSSGKRIIDGDSSMFLSGILYSKSKSLCIVALPSGESRVFESGESIDGKKFVKAIKPDSVLIRSGTDRDYKVGQEIYAK